MIDTTPAFAARLFIDGGERDTVAAEQFDDIDPATGRPFAQVARGRAADVDAAVQAARRALRDWCSRTPHERGRFLLRLAARILRSEDELARLESQDTGKPLHEALDDVQTVAAYFQFYGEAADKVYGDRIEVPGGFGLTQRIPHGVTGHIIPWNFPIALVGRTLAPALAMGNACVLKPAEEAPLSAIKVAQLATEVGFPPGVVNVVPGFGGEAGVALARHPDVDHISFTGSREVGQEVMHASAEQLRPVMLELGGKSPSVVFSDADLTSMVPVLRSAVLTNCGQTCNAGTRLLVEGKLHRDLVEALVEAMRNLRIGPGLTDPDLGPLVSEKQHQRVASYVAIGKGEGATLVLGGERPSERPEGYFFEPTIFDTANPGLRIAREEIFGPVLTVIPFERDKQAAEIANSTSYDLAAAVWTQDIDRAFRLAQTIRAGQVYINNWGLGTGIDFPFGGIRGSGFGREKGVEALKEYSVCKTTVVRVKSERPE